MLEGKENTNKLYQLRDAFFNYDERNNVENDMYF